MCPPGSPAGAGQEKGSRRLSHRRRAMNRFADRSQGGAALAKDLAAHLRTLDHPGRPLVLALPRGGVPVGFQVAKALDGDLDITVARKIGLPGQQEYGVGPVTPSPGTRGTPRTRGGPPPHCCATATAAQSPTWPAGW